MSIMKKTIYLLLFLLIALDGCKKSNDDTAVSPTQSEPVATENVDPDFQDFLSKQQPVNKQLKDAVFPDGQNIQEFLDKYRKANGGRLSEGAENLSGTEAKRKYLVGSMLEKGFQLSDKFKNVFYDNSDKAKPSQIGIAYSIGSKDYRPLSSPTQGSCNRDKKFHGIDCSGFIYELAISAKINLGNKLNLNAQAESNPQVWQTAIKKLGKEYDLITVKDASDDVNNQDNLLESGDIIFFYNEKRTSFHHVGMVWVDQSKNIYFLNSYGNPDKECESHFAKGPSLLGIEKQSWFNNKYRYAVLRITTPEDYMTCKIDGQSYAFTGLSYGSGMYFTKAGSVGPNTLSIQYSDNNQSVLFDISGFKKQPGSFPLNGNNSGKAHYQISKPSFEAYNTVPYAPVDNRVEITSVKEDKVEGTFNFTVTGGNGKSVSITEGEFRSKFITVL